MKTFFEEPLWQSMKSHIDNNMELMEVTLNNGSILFSFNNPAFPNKRSQTGYHIREYTTTLGIDVQGYSKNGLPEQFLTSVKLFAFIEKTIAWFEKEAPSASCRPDAIIPTGDGAYLFFGENVNSLVRAMNFAIRLNMNIQVTNNDVPLIGATYEGIKIPLRFTIAMGNALMMKDPNGTNNVVGESIIRCARVLSCDKGTHFLLEKNAADSLIQNNSTISNGIKQYAAQIFSSVQCKVSKRLRKTVKETPFDFYNLYLEYDVLDLLDSLQSKRKRSGISYVFKLGSMNLEGIQID